MICFSKDSMAAQLAEPRDLEPFFYRGFIERGIARRLLAQFYPDMTIERIAALAPAICLSLSDRDPDVIRILTGVRYRQQFEQALIRAMKDVLLDIGEGG